MKTKYIFILIVLASCQKEQKTTHSLNFNTTESPKVIVANTKEIQENSLQTDTIRIYENDKTLKNNYILAHLLDQKVDKDSVVTAKYQLVFYQNKIKTVTSKLMIKGLDKGSEWSAAYGLSSTEPKNTSFIKISFGYPACGYTLNNYLYYLKNNNLQLVHEWHTMFDSGWGSWVEFMNPKLNSDPKYFYCKTVAYEPTDDDNEDMGILTYSDSTFFELKDKHWKKQLLTVKDKAYFEKKVSFKDFHNQK